ncbi:MAG: FAD-dependent thymidylate synthase [Chloroflexi bacterium]|nr:FAD-dependent thymidylate synthase [Chloroflexota bacterium]
MKVTILEHTCEPQKLAAAAARICRHDEDAQLVLKNLSDKECSRLIDECLQKGHESVLEHASFTFAIEGISRVTTHQLVRHRIASYSQQSLRHTRIEGGDSFVIPPEIKDNEGACGIFRKCCTDALVSYNGMIDMGIKPEDARYILPMGVRSRIIVTMNARSLRNFFRLRTCSKAQWEIRETALRMLDEVREAAPGLFRDSGPPCMEGKCPEGDLECFKEMSNKIKREKNDA